MNGNKINANIDLKLLSGNLRLLRTAHGFSQEALAEEIFITRSTYSAYETGSKIPDIRTLDALSSVYGVGLESLIYCDLSGGLLGRIYFGAADSGLREVVDNYESLSAASKSIVTERLDSLLERESVFFNEYGTRKK